MNNIEDLLTLLPPIKPADINKVTTPLTYIGAAGFEDRALAVLDKILKLGKGVSQVIAIEYEPFDKRNQKEEFQKKFNELNIPNTNVKWAIYDRYKPEKFLKFLDIIKEAIASTSNVVVDISAMSKLLIMVLLHGLRNLDVNLSLVYAEADIYHPTFEKFGLEKQRYQSETESLPIFLTTAVYDIVTTSSLSTVAMQGYPLMMITFPTFNYNELSALVNEITHQHLILLEGRPHERHNDWRLEAIRWLNRRIIKHLNNGEILTEEKRIVSTFDYKETIKILEEIYQSYKYSRKIVVVPTGSKFQTFGMFLFKQMHPDIQVIYPVTKKFADMYTKGYKAIWEISFPSFSRFLSQLDGYRKGGLFELNNAIQVALKT